MIFRTISLCQGKGSIGHNNRVFHTKNTNPELTPNNIIFMKQPIGEAYERLFCEAVERYNSRQTRNDRKIKNSYFEYQFGQPVTEIRLTSPDKRKSFYEDVVQLGTMDDTGVGTVDGERATQCLCEYMNGFQKRNPNFYVFNAVLHLDEKTPHLHIDYIPVGHYKRGVDTQNGIAQALKEMGYGNGKDAIAKWRQAEYLVFRKICEEHGFHIAEPKKSRGSLTVEEYKNYCADKKRLNDKLKPLREMELAADESTVVGKKHLLSHNITVTPEEFEQLETQKKAVAVQQIDNQCEKNYIERCKEDLREREAEISADLAERTKALDEREAEISHKEEQLDILISDAKILQERAEYDFERAKEEREFQRDLNQRYSELSDKFHKSERDNFKKDCQIHDICEALKVPYTATDDAIERCREVVDENYQIKDCIAKELNLGLHQRVGISLSDMLKMFIDNFRNKVKENEENKSVIASLREQLSTVKEEFKKVAYAVNELVYGDGYKFGLSGWAKALAGSISLFAINCLQKRGEYDDLYDGTGLDEEIQDTAKDLYSTNQTKERNYYER